MRNLLVLAALFTSTPSLAQGDSPVGQWLTEGGQSRVEIYTCGEELCGRIIWLKEPNEADGTPKLDVLNKDESLRTRPLVGLAFIAGFLPNGRPGRWHKGTIYNPADGKIYQCTMMMENADTLRVHGYVLLPVFGKSQTWIRFRD